jgi:Tol biopolymer transport system component
MQKTMLKIAVCALVSLALLSSAQEAPVGSPATPSKDEQKALDAMKGAVKGKIVWSSSRSHSKHDIWIMNADGTEQKALTNSPENVDWFPRISPDGAKVLFVRSQSGWVPENDAEMYTKWKVMCVNMDGTNEKLIADTAVWATWRPSGDSIVFARGPKVFIKSLATSEEKEIYDAEKSYKKGTNAQQPELSPNGKWIGVTLRGTKRDVIIWNREKNEGYSLSGGCELTWFPDNKRAVRMNEGQGNGSTEVLVFDIDGNGKPVDVQSGMSINKKFRFMDLPGRRSHEYFPQISPDGVWMVWGATQYGHEHDISNYQIYLWKIGTDAKTATRLTFHSGNDRWPDIFIAK